jgi:signal transduction histidine kinase/ActR/RegA family two-component response regulator
VFAHNASSPLRRRLVILAGVAIIPLALIAGAGLYFLSVHQAEQTRNVGLELSRSVANAVDTELRGAITILQTLATAPSLDQNDVSAFRERAVRIVGVQKDWAAITITDPSGTVVVDTRVGAGMPPLPVIDTASFDSVIQTKRPVVGRLTRYQDGEWYFPVRVPVIRDQKLRSVLSSLIRPSVIYDVIERQHTSDDWLISIVDQDRRRVARSRAHDQNLGGWLTESAQALVTTNGAEGYGVTTTIEGERIYTPYSRIPVAGWTAVLGIPTRTVDVAASRSLWTFGAGVVISILLATLGATWVARGVTGPIGELRAAAEALGRRERPVVPSSSIAEVREVGQALTAAAAEIGRFEAERDELLHNERIARETAERADRAKEEFLAILSHELRTPLNAVFGWARLLQTSQLDAAMSARAQEAIVRNADAQVRLIDDLLDLSRVSSGKLRLSLSTVAMAEVIQGALDAVRPSAEAKGIRIVTALDADPGRVAGDSARLQQIVWNLLVNAVKFTANGGEVLLRLHRRDDAIEIAVSDTGQGISAEVLPHVFEWFRQGDSTSTRRHGGLGLGLALVKHLAELHGGTVTAHSAGAGLGATFTVTLPVATSDQAVATATSPLADAMAVAALKGVVRLDGLRIVVADDQPDARVLAETILASAGADVRSCGSAAEALALVQDCRPHVLVSDLEMPVEDGYMLIAKVRALPGARGGLTPAIALSAYGRPQDRLRAIAAGFNMHVPKPVDPGELTEIISSLCGGARAPSAAIGYGNIPSSL